MEYYAIDYEIKSRSIDTNREIHLICMYYQWKKQSDKQDVPCYKKKKKGGVI